ncbi:MAG: sigma 54-interacting transcriptional regulator [Emergencia sp.]|nr:sigma 54-interacting transcriptional regulator [Emergencia sp.]
MDLQNRKPLLLVGSSQFIIDAMRRQLTEILSDEFPILAYDLTAPGDLPTPTDFYAFFSDKDTETAFYNQTGLTPLPDGPIAKRISRCAGTPDDRTTSTAQESDYRAKYHFTDIIGESPQILHAKRLAERIAPTDLSMLIEGDNGTGKSLFASAIHNASSRSKKPFAAINLSALPDQLVDTALFGSDETGSSTVANTEDSHIGLFQRADGGTLFLNEIGDLSLPMQVKLLRVLQEREIIRPGSGSIPVDVRIIASTSKDLSRMIENNTFRKDLYYRLKEGHLRLPTLDLYKEDIPSLIAYWQQKGKISSKVIDPDVLESFMVHTWPGNIRELLNTLKFSMTVSETDTVTIEDLPFDSPKPSTGKEKRRREPSRDTDQTSLLILEAIRRINQRGEIAGRNRIFWYLRDSGFEISEYKIRKAITMLSDQGLVSASHGKYGLSLTNKGVLVFETNSSKRGQI